MSVLLERWESSWFDWSTWRNGSPGDVFQIPCRTNDLLRQRAILQAHAVGWCPGTSTPCRPKAEHVAVMFYKEGRYFWFHLRQHESTSIFGIPSVSHG